MNEDKKIIIDVKKLLPQVARRMYLLEHLHRTWQSVVGPAAARHSAPYDLINNDLYVKVTDNHTAQIIANMKGTIARKIADRYDYHEDVKIKITQDIAPETKAKTKPAAVQPKKSKQAVTVDENLVNKYIAECPDALPDDAKLAISRLRAYLHALRP